MKDLEKIKKIAQPKSDREWSEVKKNIVLNWYSFLTRKLSIHITKVLVKTPITPNQITFIGTLIAMVGCYSLTFGSYLYSILGVTSFHIFSFLDHVDGEVARYKKAISLKGEFLDGMVANLIMMLAFLSITIGAFNSHSTIPILNIDTYQNYLVILAGTLSASTFLLMETSALRLKYIICHKIRKQNYVDYGLIINNNLKTLLVNIYLFFRADVNIFTLMLVFSLIGILYLIPIFYSILFPLMFILQLCTSFKRLQGKNK